VTELELAGYGIDIDLPRDMLAELDPSNLTSLKIADGTIALTELASLLGWCTKLKSFIFVITDWVAGVDAFNPPASPFEIIDALRKYISHSLERLAIHRRGLGDKSWKVPNVPTNWDSSLCALGRLEFLRFDAVFLLGTPTDFNMAQADKMGAVGWALLRGLLLPSIAIHA
jgi:hypothetical protein